jgi:dihydrofolate reductase
MRERRNREESAFKTRPPHRPFVVVGHAIVSDDDRIAAADGSMPAVLRNDVDWRRFQDSLDAADLIVLGREGHDAIPNRPHRRRLVLTSRADGLERDRSAPVGQVFRLNPAKMPLVAALDALLPIGGHVAVAGGTRVFDLFLAFGYDRFDLVRARGARLPGGRPLFAASDRGVVAETVLAGAGLAAAERAVLDAAAGVELTVYRAPRR